MDLKFKCPRDGCDGTELQEIVSLDTVINPVTRLDSEGDHDYGPMYSESDSAVECYQCSRCGWVVPQPAAFAEDGADDPIRAHVTLAEWLKAQPYNKEDSRDGE
jgi:hypothetical protein